MVVHVIVKIHATVIDRDHSHRPYRTRHDFMHITLEQKDYLGFVRDRRTTPALKKPPRRRRRPRHDHCHWMWIRSVRRPS
jgi:hypothetical protein